MYGVEAFIPESKKQWTGPVPNLVHANQPRLQVYVYAWVCVHKWESTVNISRKDHTH